MPGELNADHQAVNQGLTPRAPIMELMKTPSRTQTVKRTRAATTAMKERGEKLKALNLHVGSPVSKTSTPSVRVLLDRTSIWSCFLSLTASELRCHPSNPVRSTPLNCSRLHR